MLAELDETLKHLLIEKGELDPAKVEFTFVRPAADLAKSQAGAGINFYLYAIRESLELQTLIGTSLQFAPTSALPGATLILKGIPGFELALGCQRPFKNASGSTF